MLLDAYFFKRVITRSRSYVLPCDSFFQFKHTRIMFLERHIFYTIHKALDTNIYTHVPIFYSMILDLDRSKCILPSG